MIDSALEAYFSHKPPTHFLAASFCLYGKLTTVVGFLSRPIFISNSLYAHTHTKSANARECTSLTLTYMHHCIKIQQQTHQHHFGDMKKEQQVANRIQSKESAIFLVSLVGLSFSPPYHFPTCAWRKRNLA